MVDGREERERSFVFDVEKALARAQQGGKQGGKEGRVTSVLSGVTRGMGKEGGQEGREGGRASGEKESVSIAGRDTEAAARVFSRVLTKSHLKRLVVLGQVGREGGRRREGGKEGWLVLAP